MTPRATPSAPSRTWWTPAGRVTLFLLGAVSIGCLLAEFYLPGSMRTWVCAMLLPACAFLVILALIDRQRNDGLLAQMIARGVLAGLAAAMAYDVFRAPFVWSRAWHLDHWLPPLALFKVFPRFGAMILGQSPDAPHFSIAAHLLGWLYHFSNGALFGVMYVAMVGMAARRRWLWAVAMAVVIEVGMLLTPYPRLFHIRVDARFVTVTLSAHLIFGCVLGLLVRRWTPAVPAYMHPRV
jgi:hypothetical protein